MLISFWQGSWGLPERPRSRTKECHIRRGLDLCLLDSWHERRKPLVAGRRQGKDRGTTGLLVSRGVAQRACPSQKSPRKRQFGRLDPCPFLPQAQPSELPPCRGMWEFSGWTCTGQASRSNKVSKPPGGGEGWPAKGERLRAGKKREGSTRPRGLQDHLGHCSLWNECQAHEGRERLTEQMESWGGVLPRAWPLDHGCSGTALHLPCGRPASAAFFQAWPPSTSSSPCPAIVSLLPPAF